MRKIYLDHTATTPLDDRVLEAMRPYFTVFFGNASSAHSYGREAKAALEGARSTVARAMGAESGELFFTSGGTESDNFAIRGVAHSGRRKGKNHVVTTAAEHHAVLDTCKALVQDGFEVTVLPVDGNGAVGIEDLLAALTPRTSLVSLMHANNEVGTIADLKGLVAAVHERGALMHTDAVQTLGKIPLNVNELGVDLATVTAHKLYGPKGIGALYIRRGAEIDPLLHGGGQERGRRPGTENVALAVGFARAVELAVAGMKEESDRLRALRDLLEQRILTLFTDVLVNGDPERRLPHILNISFDSRKISLEGDMLLMNMDLHGIAASSGSACTSGSVQPSHVLLAMGRTGETAKATLRFSFGRSNSEADVEYVAETLLEVVNQMKRV